MDIYCLYVNVLCKPVTLGVITAFCFLNTSIVFFSNLLLIRCLHKPLCLHPSGSLREGMRLDMEKRQIAALNVRVSPLFEHNSTSFVQSPNCLCQAHLLPNATDVLSYPSDIFCLHEPQIEILTSSVSKQDSRVCAWQKKQHSCNSFTQGREIP